MYKKEEALMSKYNEDITFEQIIAGLLTKFDFLDSVDFNLLLQDFRIKSRANLTGLWYHFPNIGQYVQVHEDAIITLRDGVFLDDFIEKEGLTVLEKFLNVAGNCVSRYLKFFNENDFRKSKNYLLLKNKEDVLKKANVLFFSDRKEEYKMMQEYGFKNIDSFKSIILADSYFKKNKKQLEKYQIIIFGSQSIRTIYSYGKIELDNTIHNLCQDGKVLSVSILVDDLFENTFYSTHLFDSEHSRNWEEKSDSYFKLFDKIVENAFINHVMEKKGKIYRQYLDYMAYEQAKRISLPVKKSDLKILYLDSSYIGDDRNLLAKELGLNITFQEDNNFSLAKYVGKHLGDYDIILASHIYSSNLLLMGKESVEQCRNTGRNLTLLVTYQEEELIYQTEDFEYEYGVLGNKITLNYIYGREKDSEVYQKEFRVASDKKSLNVKNQYLQNAYVNMKSMIETSVYLYNKALPKNKITDLRFKTAEEYDREYQLLEEADKNRRNKISNLIQAFDEMTSVLFSYLTYKKCGLIKEPLIGLTVCEDDVSIRIENNCDGDVLCAITLLKQYLGGDNIRIFDVEVLTKKKILQAPDRVGIYIKKYENMEGVPKLLNEKQMQVVYSIQKKVDHIMKPLVEKRDFAIRNEERSKVYVKKSE